MEFRIPSDNHCFLFLYLSFFLIFGKCLLKAVYVIGQMRTGSPRNCITQAGQYFGVQRKGLVYLYHCKFDSL